MIFLAPFFAPMKREQDWKRIVDVVSTENHFAFRQMNGDF